MRLVLHEKVAPAETVWTGRPGYYEKAPYRIPPSGFYEFVEYVFESEKKILIHSCFAFEEKKISPMEKPKTVYYKFIDGKKGNFMIEVTESDKYILEWSGYIIGQKKPRKQRIDREKISSILEKYEVNYCISSDTVIYADTDSTK